MFQHWLAIPCVLFSTEQGTAMWVRGCQEAGNYGTRFTWTRSYTSKMSARQEVFDLVVVGGAVLDFFSYAARIPRPGETVFGHSSALGFGGKGANDAVMAAKLGARTALIAKVGDDLFGKNIIDNLRRNKINVENVLITSEASTTTASVIVDDSGRTSIVEIWGARALLTPDDVRRAEPTIANARILICTLEVKQETILEALRIAKKYQVQTVFNPSPHSVTICGVDGELYKLVDIICMNEAEAECLTGGSGKGRDIDATLMELLDLGPKVAIITMAENGCVFATGTERNVVRVETPQVELVDPTGAGDAFLGSLAYFSASCPRMPLKERIRRSCGIASITVQSAGAQASYPEREKIQALLEWLGYSNIRKMVSSGAKELDLVVVGGICQDFTSYSPRFPKPGEAIRGHGFEYGCGGNGSNQSVMAARLGCKTAMVGKVGGDMFGQGLIDNLLKNGVNVDHVGVAENANTATAAIIVDDAGQNKIANVPGANLEVKLDDVRKAESKVSKARVVLCGLEVDQQAALEALKLGKKHGATTIFNASPMPANGLSNEYFNYSDILCINEHETHKLVGFPLKTDQDIDQALSVLLKRGAKTAIITLSEKGCAFATVENNKPVHVPAPTVKAVDATGAGDAFVGSLAYFIACCSKLPLQEQLRRCCQIAAKSVQSLGTQPSYPVRDQLPKELLE